jgi:hypothetical protein
MFPINYHLFPGSEVKPKRMDHPAALQVFILNLQGLSFFNQDRKSVV